MKQPKKLTRTQKEFLTSKSIDWREWMLLDETEDTYLFVHRKSGVTQVMEKPKRKQILVLKEGWDRDEEEDEED